MVKIFGGLLITAGLLLTIPGKSEEMHLAKEWTFREGSGQEKVFQFGKNHEIDLDQVAGRTGKCYDECVIINHFELKKETKLGFGAGADWWFEVKLNGKTIFSTFPKGNSGFLIISYGNFRFCGTGKAGKNQLEIRVRRGVASWKFCLKEESAEMVDPCSELTMEADAGLVIGKIKPMNAVNNGPIKGRRSTTRGNFESYRKLEIPFARNHDASFCSSYGGEHTVDVHAIFPDFSKDADDPASYDFARTDRYLKTIMEAGSKVFYRLGSKIEPAPEKYGTKVPPDFKKWAVICEHIIRHYNEGWANGFKMNIEYWEIWNEPDLPPGRDGLSASWQGTPEQFFEFYRVTALHLKKCFPKLKIGGPALAGNHAWAEKFLAAMKATPRVPLDFFSWHFYANNPITGVEKAQIVRKMLDENGYRKTESILNEWNYIRNWSEHYIYTIRQIIGLKGAVFTAAMMSRFQDAPVDMLMYYDARPCCLNGLFDFYTYAPLKGYYSLLAWSKLVRLGRQFKVDVKGKNGLAATGATDGKGHVGILVSRFFEQDDLPGDLPLTLKVKGTDLRGAKLYLLDETHDLTDVAYRMNPNGEILFSMKANTVLYLEAGKE